MSNEPQVTDDNGVDTIVLPKILMANFNYPHWTFEQGQAQMIELLHQLGAQRQEYGPESLTKERYTAEYNGGLTFTFSLVEHPTYAGLMRVIIPGIGNIDIAIFRDGVVAFI